MARVIVFELAVSSDYPNGGVSVTIPSYNDGLRPEGDTDDALLARTIERSVLARKDSEGALICRDGAYHVTDSLNIPTDRGFRDAWTLAEGKVVVDMEKARRIHMDAIRQARDLELAVLDVPWMVAVEKGDTVSAGSIAARKQLLRDIPQTFDLMLYGSPESLSVSWPADLARPS